MRIECLTTFLDGKERFEAGDVRTVDDELAQKFSGLGWAKEAGAPAGEAAVGEPISTTLNVHSGVIGVQDTQGGQHG